MCGWLHKHSSTNLIHSNYSSRYVVLTPGALHWFLKPHDGGHQGDEDEAASPSILFGTHRGSIPLSAITQMNIMGGGVLHVSTKGANYRFRNCPEHHGKGTSSWSPDIDSWHLAIKKQKNLLYINQPSPGGDEKERKQSISGSYFQPPPTIQCVLSDKDECLCASPGYGVTVTTRKLPRSERWSLNLILSDGQSVELALSGGKGGEKSTATRGEDVFSVEWTERQGRDVNKRALLVALVTCYGAVSGAHDLLDYFEKDVASLGLPDFSTMFAVLVVVSLTSTLMYLSDLWSVYELRFALEQVEFGVDGGGDVSKDGKEDLEADAAIAVAAQSEHTCLDSIAALFEQAMDKDSKEIDLEKLLRAAMSFLDILRAMGPTMTLAVKDFQGNYRKAQMQFGKDKAKFANLKACLQGEKETGIHKPGGINKDPSSAAGLLWMRRSISFQVAIFEALLAGGETATLPAATGKAYADELEVYHGWLLKKIFGKVISSSPSRESFAEKLAPNVIDSMRQVVVDRDMATFCEKLNPILEQWKSVYAELDLEDVRKV